MYSLKLYGTGSATANAVASVIVPSRTTIIGVQASVLMDSVTDNANIQIEVSRASAREIAVNGAQQCICEVGLYSNFVTSGLSQPGINTFFPVSIDTVQGQIIYLHAAVTGTATFYATMILWYR